jgi:hypothetical protein
MCAFVSKRAKIAHPYVKQRMAQSLADTQHVIEIPVKKQKHAWLNLGNFLIVGGIGYVLLKTFLLEERVNNLAISLKRKSGNGVRSDISPETPNTTQYTENDYETSDDDDDDDDDESSGDREHVDEDDEVRMEEQSREVPPLAEIPTRQVAVATPPASAFVTTRQRRSGSELRRHSSKTEASARQA